MDNNTQKHEYNIEISPTRGVELKLVDEVFGYYGRFDREIRALNKEQAKLSSQIEAKPREKMDYIQRLMSELTQGPLKLILKPKEKEKEEDKSIYRREDYYLYRHGLGKRNGYDARTTGLVTLGMDDEKIELLEKACLRKFQTNRTKMKRQKIRLAFELIRLYNKEEQIDSLDKMSFMFPERTFSQP